MQQAANAYSKIAEATHSPRELEAAVLMKAASRLQTIRDDWDGRQRELFAALTYNRKLWTILVSSATDAANPLPAGIKQNVANLGIFIFNHTLAVMTQPAPERLAILIHQPRDRRRPARPGGAGRLTRAPFTGSARRAWRGPGRRCAAARPRCRCARREPPSPRRSSWRRCGRRRSSASSRHRLRRAPGRSRARRYRFPERAQSRPHAPRRGS